jgi:putative hydrolase of the HAD superfamily
MPPRAVLWDLDDTLFDHTHASRCATADLQRAVPDFRCWSIDEFLARHRELLDELHVEVLAGRLTIPDARIERFRRLLVAAACRNPDEIAPGLAGSYREAYERAWQTVPGAVPLLTALREQDIRIAVVTNNIVVEQQTKLRHCGLTDLIDSLVTSEEIGSQKPDPKIFHAALDIVGAKPGEAVMVGDAWATDIEGARAAGVRPVWLNRFGALSRDPAVPELRSLEPLEKALQLILATI